MWRSLDLACDAATDRARLELVDQLTARVRQARFVFLDLPAQPVEEHDGRNGNHETVARDVERLTDQRADDAETTAAFLTDDLERPENPEDGAEKTDERGRRTARRENRETLVQAETEILTGPLELALREVRGSVPPHAKREVVLEGLDAFIDEAGKMASFGTGLPSVTGEYILSGASQSFHFWVPADAGYVTAFVALQTLKGIEVKEGDNLGKPGYESITIQYNDAGVPVIYGSAWVDVNKDNLDDWKNPDGSWKL